MQPRRERDEIAPPYFEQVASTRHGRLFLSTDLGAAALLRSTRRIPSSGCGRSAAQFVSLVHLVELAVLGIKPGSGRRPHEYLLALPKRIAEDDVPPFCEKI